MDGIEHHLYYCTISNKFWNQVKSWMINNLDLPTYKNPDLKIINFIVLIGKWYLNNSKTQNKPIYFFDFISLDKEKTEILRSVTVGC